MKKAIYTVRRKADDKRFNMFPQAVDLNVNGRYCLRYNIGINGYTEWTFIEAIYDNNEFNKRYEVVGVDVYGIKEVKSYE